LSRSHITHTATAAVRRSYHRHDIGCTLDGSVSLSGSVWLSGSVPLSGSVSCRMSIAHLTCQVRFCKCTVTFGTPRQSLIAVPNVNVMYQLSHTARLATRARQQTAETNQAVLTWHVSGWSRK